MYLPSRRWIAVGAGLSLVALLGLAWPAALAWLLVLDALWFLGLVIDGLNTPAPDTIQVKREVPPAFSLGRTLPVWYHWSHAARRTLVAARLSLGRSPRRKAQRGLPSCRHS